MPPEGLDRVVAFGCFSAASFLLVTLLYGEAWFPGGWSSVGLLIFLLWVVILAIGVVQPFRPWVRASTPTPSRRRAFYLLFLASFFLWLVGVDALQGVSPSSPGSLEVLPILTPYGLMPTAEFAIGPVGGFLNLQLVVGFLLLSYLWAGVVLVQWENYQRGRACAPAVPSKTGGLRDHASTLLTWAPLLGLSSGCCSPPLLEFLFLGAVPASSRSFAVFRSLNWMWDGILELVSVVVLVVLIRRATRPGLALSEEALPEATGGTPAPEGVSAVQAGGEGPGATAWAPDERPAGTGERGSLPSEAGGA